MSHLHGHRDGDTYDPELDYSRLNGQQERVARVMADGQWRSLGEIQAAIERRFDTHDPQASISARLRDLRKEKFGGYTVERQRRGQGKKGLYEYRLDLDPDPPVDEHGQAGLGL